MYMDLFNEEKKKKFIFYGKIAFGLFVVSLVLTILFWNIIGIPTLLLSIISFILFLYLWSWVANSNRFNDLRDYMDSGYGDEIIRVLFHARMNLEDKELYKELKLTFPFYFAYVDEVGGHYDLSFKDKGYTFHIRFTDTDIKYSYDETSPHESDERMKTHKKATYHYLDKTDFENLDFKGIIRKVMKVFESEKIKR